MITQTSNAFINTLDNFSDEQVNEVPFTGSWTPGQVADHIIKATGGIPDRYTEEPQRPIDEKVAPMEAVFLDFVAKYKSPDFVVPGGGPFDKGELIDVLKGIQSKHVARIREVDLGAVCLNFELPGIGKMTRYEWYRFIAAHMQRHLFQLKNILDSLRLKATI